MLPLKNARHSPHFRFCLPPHLSTSIWIVEITNVSRLSKEKDEERTIFGEVLIDVTATRYGSVWLAIHLPGNLFLRDPNTEKGRHIPVPDDTPYRHPSPTSPLQCGSWANIGPEITFET